MAGFAQAEGLGGTERTNEASAFAEGPSGKSERQLAEQLPRSSLVAHSETAGVEGMRD
jgi:hypothetical protein